jgi:hypothetical protein
MGGSPGTPGSICSAVKVEEVGRVTALFPGGAGGTPCAFGDDGPHQQKTFLTGRNGSVRVDALH